MHKFSINSRKNTILLLVMILILAILIIGIIICEKNNMLRVTGGGIVGLGGGIYFLTLIIWDFRAEIEIREEGIYSDRRRKKVLIPWRLVRRLEYKGNRHIPISETLVIHTNNGFIYVDYNFQDYLKAWEILIHECEERNKETIIDQKLRERLSIKN